MSIDNINWVLVVLIVAAALIAAHLFVQIRIWRSNTQMTGDGSGVAAGSQAGDQGETPKRIGGRKLTLVLALIIALLFAGGGAIGIGFALSEKENALALIALIVAPALTVITALTTILVTLVKGLDESS